MDPRNGEGVVLENSTQGVFLVVQVDSANGLGLFVWGGWCFWMSEGDPFMESGIVTLRAPFRIPNHRDPNHYLKLMILVIPNLPGFLKPCLFFWLFSTRRFMGSNFARKDHLDAFVCGADLTDVDLQPVP